MPEIVFDHFGIRHEVELTPEQLAADKAIADAYDNSVVGLTHRLKSEFGTAVDLASPLLASLPASSRRRHNALITEFLGASQRGDVEVSLEILFQDFKPVDEIEQECLSKIGKFFDEFPALLGRIEKAKEVEGANA